MLPNQLDRLTTLYETLVRDLTGCTHGMATWPESKALVRGIDQLEGCLFSEHNYYAAKVKMSEMRALIAYLASRGADVDLDRLDDVFDGLYDEIGGRGFAGEPGGQLPASTASTTSTSSAQPQDTVHGGSGPAPALPRVDRQRYRRSGPPNWPTFPPGSGGLRPPAAVPRVVPAARAKREAAPGTAHWPGGHGGYPWRGCPRRRLGWAGLPPLWGSPGCRRGLTISSKERTGNLCLPLTGPAEARPVNASRFRFPAPGPGRPAGPLGPTSSATLRDSNAIRMARRRLSRRQRRTVRAAGRQVRPAQRGHRLLEGVAERDQPRLAPRRAEEGQPHRQAWTPPGLAR